MSHLVPRLNKICGNSSLAYVLPCKAALQSCHMVPTDLQESDMELMWRCQILGTSMTTKMWEVTVDHARTCTLDNRLHLYFPINSQKKTGVVFNAVGQADAHKLVLSAFEHMDKVVSFDNETSMLAFLWRLAYSNSPWLESLGGCYVDTDDGYDHIQPSTSSHANEVFSFDDETSLMHDALQLSSAAYTSNSLSLENPNSFNFETSHFNDECIQPSTYSPGISSFFLSYGSTSNWNEYGLHGAGNEDHLDDQAFGSPGNFVNPLFCYAESINQSCEDEHLPSFDTDHSVQYQNSNFESQGDLQSIVNGFLSRAAVARRSWTLLFGVLRWYSRRKIAALKFVSSEKIHATKKSRIY
ncbi:hypothetical protein TEA_016991 [Camellia sinensis var. sinensis]|uniref:Uncharacterized protein n=1 Tax=Camellia sinensis var. sinensis TaxID=542762 RepID=A0A4S4D201_CAMSN|nr:hypothetical protein TEA_016991 [Camellia sinensis var. sinensis]